MGGREVVTTLLIKEQIAYMQAYIISFRIHYIYDIISFRIHDASQRHLGI